VRGTGLAAAYRHEAGESLRCTGAGLVSGSATPTKPFGAISDFWNVKLPSWWIQEWGMNLAYAGIRSVPDAGNSVACAAPLRWEIGIDGGDAGNH
jgi:hypothetical protein